MTLDSQQIRILRSQEKSNILSVKARGLELGYKGYISGSYAHQQDTENVSGFATHINREYELGLEKIWSQGFKSALSYKLSDNIFASRSRVLSPELELSVSTSIFQDLWGGQYKYQLAESKYSLEEAKEEFIELYSSELARGLLLVLNYLETSEELSFQSQLCQGSKKQLRSLRSKIKRKSISQRDYYLSQKEVVSCELLIDNLEKRQLEVSTEYLSLYNKKIESLKNVNIEKLFKEIKNVYFEFSKSPIDLDAVTSIKKIEAEANVNKNRLKRLKALSANDFSLEVSAGLRNENISFSRAQSDIEDFNSPYFRLGFRMSLPWSSTKSTQEYKSALYLAEASDQRVKLEKDKILKGYKALTIKIEKDFLSYDKYLKSVSLSKKILKEARKDYNNGRVDFISLVEVNNSVIDSQRSLSSFRAALLEQVIEQLSIYNFFDQYLVSDL